MVAGYPDLTFIATTMSLIGVRVVGCLNIGSVGDGGRDEQLSWLNLKVHPSLRSCPLPIIPFCFPSRAKEAKQQKKKKN